MFVPCTRRQLIVALALGVFTVTVLPGFTFASVLDMTTATTTGPTQNGIFAPAPNDWGILNLTNNAWIVNTGPGVDPVALEGTLQAMIAQGFDNFVWDGQPSASQHSVISSFLPAANAGQTYTQYPNAATDPNATTGIGIETGTDFINNSATGVFYGVTVTPNMVLMKYTFYGDTDLNGMIDPGDLANSVFAQAAHLTGWANGKTDYTNNPVNVGDLANSVFSQAAQGQAIYAHPLAEGAASVGSLGVPEPATATLVGLAALVGALGALRLRRREG